ncbi:MAG: hydantoinase/oxoprolinase family protein [Planctomycetota bacterium]
MIVAIDIGGANLKLARSDGQYRSSPFPLWQKPSELSNELVRFLPDSMPASRLLVTMTGELCDCYTSRAHGVTSIANAVLEATGSLGAASPEFWTTRADLVSHDSLVAEAELGAASNWVALAEWSAHHLKTEAMLVDIGSTTSDLIAIGPTGPRIQGRDDTARLESGELVYTGVGRSPIASLLATATLRGRKTRLAAENFATTADAYTILGDLSPDADRVGADGRPGTLDESRHRLARMFCFDSPAFTHTDAVELSAQIRKAQLARLADAWQQVTQSTRLDPRCALVCGSGEFLAAQLAESLGIENVLRLSEIASPLASECACAFALVRLAEDAII